MIHRENSVNGHDNDDDYSDNSGRGADRDHHILAGYKAIAFPATGLQTRL